jgi:hypothetical protein
MSEASVADRSWHAVGITLLAVRVIQGFIYWGGGSRRFIYAPSKCRCSLKAGLPPMEYQGVKRRDFP